MLLCGRMLPPLTYTSSPMDTSSPSTLTFSRRAHLPMLLFQPTMVLLTHAWSLTLLLASSTQRCSRTPSPTTTFGPIVTLGPMRQFFPILALGSTSTLPPYTYFVPGGASFFDPFLVSELRYRQVPLRKSLGWPTSIQNPSRSNECSSPSAQMAGKVSCSMLVGRSSMRRSTLGLSR